MSRLIDVNVPDIGDYNDVPVIELLVQVGDTVAADDAIVTLESDKATMDVPSPQAGVVRELLVKVGDRVSEGSALARIEAADTAGATAAPEPAPAPAPTAPAPAPAAAAPAPATVVPPPAAPEAVSAPPASGKRTHASPSVRHYAREHGVDLAGVSASGRNGRITREDVTAHIKAAMKGGATPGKAAQAAPGTLLDLLPWPKVDFAKFGPIDTQPLSRIKKISGANLSRNSVVIPHVTNFDEADITDLEAFRQQINTENAKNTEAAKLTLLAFLIKASVAALKKFPEFNASLDGDNLVLKQYFHIAFAADTPNGLVVPVIRDANQKGIYAIAAEAGALAKKARDGKLGPADMSGGCFTVSSLGGVGGTGFTPIINAPEVAILGVTRAQMKPVWDGKAFIPRLILPLCLSWDHRVIDGVMAARFLVYLQQILGDFRRIGLEHG
ncbi:dihydrolipoyllysine-residue acetyltransferase [Denitromonas iodatirespirans]|uniref:Acetyltransferase component of pyruvate dehydrogenase complex n=1 Tax=Denitromonas iodatirespirans TaxID=2795389 RepID=A0A944DDA1_DENI1|nr:dihydrolipoyllysine-residue acetyltransferase [Denitromonas iodatirespirans]MBT0963357.1 dihydrolipoyllysine-residue acetyltransferase [Denitromonas iodatirespirans]